MSPRAAWRLESLGFERVYDYVDGKKDWLDGGLPFEGELDPSSLIGSLANRQVPTCRLREEVGPVRDRARSAGSNGAIVLNQADVVMGFLGADALNADPSLPVGQVMAEGPVTFRPSMGMEETFGWMRENDVGTILVTSSDGSFMGVVNEADIEGRLKQPGD